MTEHLPRHLLEVLLADPSQLPAAAESRAHLAVCERCSERLRNMEAARAAFVREHSASTFAQKVMAAHRAASAPAAVQLAEAARGVPARRYAWAAGLGALALAAVALLVFQPSGAGIRYRGVGVSLQAFVQGATGVRVLQNGDVLSGGVQLAFTYSLSEPQHLLLFGIDDAGEVTRYFPDGTLVRSSALPAGAKRQLPVGIELDARPGRERLIALFSRSPLDQDSARAALESAWRQARARSHGISEALDLPLPAQQVSLWFEKR